MRLQLNVKQFLFNFSLDIVKRGNHSVQGYSNRTSDGKFVIFLDYDKYKLEWIYDECVRMNAFFGIDHFLIFQSSEKNFHLVSTCKLNPRTWTELLTSSGCDPAFKNVPRFTSYKSWILRSFEKGNKEQPRFLKLIHMPNGDNIQCSSPHLKYMLKSGLITRNLHSRLIKILKKRLDHFSHIDIIEYVTGTKVIL